MPIPGRPAEMDSCSQNDTVGLPYSLGFAMLNKLEKRIYTVVIKKEPSYFSVTSSKINGLQCSFHCYIVK